jgi:2-polyprenyl-6-methoxyphenol hydroxylase-like FAD-dependent oxidoreductase
MKKSAIGDHAVVLGASMAGLLAARVLADAYNRVTVIERDNLPPDMAHRRGVPRGLHLHGLHARGRVKNPRGSNPASSATDQRKR